MGTIDVLTLKLEKTQGSQGNKVKGSNNGTNQSGIDFADILGLIQEVSGEGQRQEEQKKDGELQSSLAGIGFHGIQLFQANMDKNNPVQTDSPDVLLTVPAGKEANSGIETSQRLSEMLAKGDVKGAWMALSSEGLPLNISELDQYRSQISFLLQELSGTIETEKPLSEVLKQFAEEGNIARLVALLQNQANGDERLDNSSLSNLMRIDETTRLGENAKQENTGVQGDGIDELKNALNNELLNRAANDTNKAANETNERESNERIFMTARSPLNSKESINAESQEMSQDERILNLKHQQTQSGEAQKIQNAKEKTDGFNSAYSEKNFEDGIFQDKKIINHNGQKEMLAQTEIDDQFVQVLNKGTHNVRGANGASFTGQSIPVWEQVSYALRRNILERTPLKNLTIQLYPAELGSIRIGLEWDNGVLHLNWKATNVSTGQALQDNMGELRQALEAMGVSCGNFETSLGNDQQGSGQQGYEHQNIHYHDDIQIGEDIFEESGEISSEDLDDSHIINVSV